MDSKIKVEKIVDNRFKDGHKQAQLRMEVTTGGGGNNLRSDLFSNEELGRETFTEQRVDWIDVPSDATVETVEAVLTNYPSARIFKILSNKPELSDNQERVITYGLSGEAFEEFKATHEIEAEEWNEECAAKMLQVIADSQVVRYGENNTEGKPADEPVLDRKGQLQYRLTLFSKDGQKDIDKRSGVAMLSSLPLADNPAYVAETVTK